ncbi:hypothetical protein BBJ28_00018713 [Nothophytophthora sp. Chile5]|nr:hypothetical protein BBJ28_00018713 [Nothophytophthora sp. Chile5]
MAGGNMMMMPQQQQMYPNGAGYTANFMTQQGAPAFGGLGAGNPQYASYNPYQQQMPAPMMMPPQYQQSPSNAGSSSVLMPMPTFSGQPIVYDNIKNLMKPSDPFATAPGGGGGLRAPEPTLIPSQPLPQLRDPKATIVDFDPFSPRDSTPRTPFDFPDQQVTAPATSSALNDRLSSFGGKRPTQEQQRSQLGFSSEGFTAASNKPSTPRISLKDVNTSASANSDDNPPFFLESSDAFMSGTFTNLDDDFDASAKSGQTDSRERKSSQSAAHSSAAKAAERGEVPAECGKGEYDVHFENGRKLGVLMERVDICSSTNQRMETAVVKLVVENGAADRVGVAIGSSVVAINRRSVANETYVAVLDLIKAAPRPLSMRFKRGAVSKDTTQGTVLTRISSTDITRSYGTFSVGNLTSGNATWGTKYFAFGGAKMDVLQLFVSRAAYHECVIALYEKRGVHTQIQSFRLCQDHKISPVKSKIYKGYGNLHYFSLTVPSLRFVAAKFASDDYDTIKNIWSNTYDAIERKKRMAY